MTALDETMVKKGRHINSHNVIQPYFLSSTQQLS